MRPFKMKDCPWQCIGEDTAGDVFWCEQCGTIYSTGEPITAPEMPAFIDRDTLYCPDQGYVV